MTITKQTPNQPASSVVSDMSPTTAQPTSRPIIVNNRPLIQDPMVVVAPQADVQPVAKAVPHKPILRPLPVQHDQDADGVVDSPIAKPGTTTAPIAKAAEVTSPEDIGQLVADKIYFLPINAAANRRSRNVALIGLVVIVLLALAWLDISLDAGFVSLPGLQPVTHFFK